MPSYFVQVRTTEARAHSAVSKDKSTLKSMWTQEKIKVASGRDEKSNVVTKVSICMPIIHPPLFTHFPARLGHIGCKFAPKEHVPKDPGMQVSVSFLHSCCPSIYDTSLII